MEQHDLGHETTPAIERLKHDIKLHCRHRSEKIEERLERIEDNHLQHIWRRLDLHIKLILALGAGIVAVLGIVIAVLALVIGIAGDCR